jgi:intein/homing endonuclease
MAGISGSQMIIDDFNNIKDSVKKTEEDLPHIALYTKPTDEKDMPKIYSSCNAFVLISRGEGFCTLPDAKIKTPMGIKEIRNINIDDLVFSHKGNVQKVIQTFKRPYNGKMIKIKSYGRNNQNICLTPNHMVRGIRASSLSTTTSLKLINNCSYDQEKDTLCHNHINSLNISNKYTNYNLEWIESGQLCVGDYLFYPKIKYSEVEVKNEVFRDNKILLNTIPLIKEKFFIKNKGIYKKSPYYVSFKNKDLNEIRVTSSKNPLFKNKQVGISRDLMKLLGYYISEGCCSNGAIKFSFSSEEIEYHKEVISLMEKVFSIKKHTIVFHKHKKSAIIIFHNIVIACLLEYLFGRGARNKSLPAWFWKLNPNMLKSFLCGLFNGDGSYKDKCSYSTSSINLANNVFDILRDLNIKSSIKKREIISNGVSREYYSVNISNIKDHNSFLNMIDNDEYKLINNRNYNVFINRENFQLVQIKEIEEIDYSGDVYNIGVDIDNSYICENIAVHNCLPIVEAASCGLPVIASNVTAHTDFLRKDNSYLVEPDGFIQSKCGGNMSRMAKLCHFYEGQNFPDFSNTGVTQTREKMREVFENYNDAKIKAEKLRSHVINNYTWDMAVDKVYHRLKEIS